MCQESDDDKLMNAMLLKLQIQISISKATGTPVLEGYEVAWLKCEFGADLATPRSLFDGLSRPSCLLNRSNVLPGLVVAWTVAMMQRIEDAKLRLPRSSQDLQHMSNTIIYFSHSLRAIPYLASLGNEIIVRIDDE